MKKIFAVEAIEAVVAPDFCSESWSGFGERLLVCLIPVAGPNAAAAYCYAQ